jgi:iron(III) transport system substrate-binding protein
MIRLFVAAVALLLALPVLAAPGDVRRFPAQAKATAQLRIHGTTDIEVFAVVIADYQRLHPGTEVVYEDIITQDLYARYLHDRAGQASPDLLISSGMDLQTKLVNDGHALPHRSAQTAALPAWAQWRNEAFGISYEPVVMVYNTRMLPAAKVPHTRRQLLDRLRAEGAPLRGRVGTYDIERSSVGYLLSTQDAQRGSIAGALLGALGDNDVVREERTGVLLDKVASGQLSLVYNVLGSYAQARIDAGAPLGIVEPEDYTLVVLRTAVIPRTGPHPEEARRFLDYLLSPRGQQVLSREARLMPIVTGNARGDDAPGRSRRPIQLGPGLLVYLDALKRRQFLDAWRSSGWSSAIRMVYSLMPPLYGQAGASAPCRLHAAALGGGAVLAAEPAAGAGARGRQRRGIGRSTRRAPGRGPGAARPDHARRARFFRAAARARLASGHPGGDPLVQRPPPCDPPRAAVRCRRFHPEVGPGRDHRRGRAGSAGWRPVVPGDGGRAFGGRRTAGQPPGAADAAAVPGAVVPGRWPAQQADRLYVGVG